MKKTWQPLTLLPVAATVLASIGLLVMLGWVGLRGGDRYEIDRQKELLGNTFRIIAERVGHEILPQIYWQDAYEHTKERDIPWVDENLGKYMTSLFGYKYLLILNSSDELIYAIDNSGDRSAASYDAMAPALTQTLQELHRAQGAAAEGRPADGLVLKTLNDGSTLPLVTVGNLERLLGQPSVVVAATILPDLSSKGFTGKPDILIVAAELNTAFLKDIEDDFGFRGLEWGSDATNGRMTYDLRSDAGHLVGTLSWLPDRPTATFVRQIAPALALGLLVLLAVSVATMILTHRFTRAESGNRSKAAFLATMSHEIRTPLNGIVGMAELMEGPDLSADQRSRLAVIRECSDALLELINDILDFSKLEAGQGDIELREFDLADVIETVMEIAGARARPKGLCLVGAYPLRTVVSDPTRVRQILLNLVGNAVKFTEKGDVTVSVSELGRRGRQDWLRFEVQDSGIGIAPETQDRLFREFSQVDSSIRRRFGGTGLGLAISARLATALGGEIGVVSDVGHGSTFWFELPVGTSAQQKRKPAVWVPRIALFSRSTFVNLYFRGALMDAGYSVASTSPPEPGDRPLIDLRSLDGGPDGFDGDISQAIIFGFGAAAFAGRARSIIDGPLTVRKIIGLLEGEPVREAGLGERPVMAREGRILLVEDNAINQQVAEGLLTRMNLSVVTAWSGVEAVELAAGGDFGLVLMDMQMPGMDGLEATRRIRTLPGEAAKVAIVGLTANAFASDRQACLAAGMNGFASKPINRRKLEAILDEFLPSGGVPVTKADGAHASTPPAAEDLVDAGQQASLRHELGDEAFAGLTASFWQSLDTIFAGIERADAASEERDRALHTLKGTAATLGFTGLAHVAAELRTELRTVGHVDTAALHAIAAATQARNAAPARETSVAA